MTTTTRRSVLAGVASTPALSLPVLATTPDPVFAAIEDYKRAFDYLSECLDKKTDIDEGLFAKAEAIANEKIKSRDAFAAANPGYRMYQTREDFFSHLRYMAMEKLRKTSEGQKAEGYEKEGGAVCELAAIAMAKTVPTTCGGMLALANIIDEHCAMGDDFTDYTDAEGNKVWLLIIRSMAKAVQS
jgi:hypothetical protein